MHQPGIAYAAEQVRADVALDRCAASMDTLLSRDGILPQVPNSLPSPRSAVILLSGSHTAVHNLLLFLHSFWLALCTDRAAHELSSGLGTLQWDKLSAFSLRDRSRNTQSDALTFSVSFAYRNTSSNAGTTYSVASLKAAELAALRMAFARVAFASKAGALQEATSVAVDILDDTHSLSWMQNFTAVAQTVQVVLMAGSDTSGAQSVVMSGSANVQLIMEFDARMRASGVPVVDIQIQCTGHLCDTQSPSTSPTAAQGDTTYSYDMSGYSASDFTNSTSTGQTMRTSLLEAFVRVVASFGQSSHCALGSIVDSSTNHVTDDYQLQVFVSFVVTGANLNTEQVDALMTSRTEFGFGQLFVAAAADNGLTVTAPIVTMIDPSSSGSDDSWIIAVSVVGAVLFIGLIAGGTWFWMRQRGHFVEFERLDRDSESSSGSSLINGDALASFTCASPTNAKAPMVEDAGNYVLFEDSVL